MNAPASTYSQTLLSALTVLFGRETNSIAKNGKGYYSMIYNTHDPPHDFSEQKIFFKCIHTDMR